MLQPPGRRLVGRTAHDAQPPSRAPQPKAEIGVLGDIVRVPPADGAQGLDAEVVAGSPEREGQAQPRQTGQRHLEQGSVLNGELPIEEGAVGAQGAAYPKWGLKSPQVTPFVVHELGGGLAQLQGIRIVLGVIDGQQLAPGLREGDIQGAGLRPGQAGRSDQDVQPGWEIEVVRRRQGFVVIDFEDQEPFQAIQGIVDLRQPLDELRQDFHLVEQGDQYRVPGQIGGRSRTIDPGKTGCQQHGSPACRQ